MDLEQKAKELQEAIENNDVFKINAIQDEVREWNERFYIDFDFIEINGDLRVQLKICKGGQEITLTPDEAIKLFNEIKPYKEHGFELPF